MDAVGRVRAVGAGTTSPAASQQLDALVDRPHGPHVEPALAHGRDDVLVEHQVVGIRGGGGRPASRSGPEPQVAKKLDLRFTPPTAWTRPPVDGARDHDALGEEL